METPVTRRRRALSPNTPSTSEYKSPYEQIELILDDKEKVKKHFADLEEINKDLRSTNSRLVEECVKTTSLDESVIIKTSNMISRDETRIYRRDCDMLNDELSIMRSARRQDVDRYESLLREKQKSDEELKKKTSELQELEMKMTEKQRELSSVNISLQRMSFDFGEEQRKRADAEGKIKKLTEELEEIREKMEKLINDLKDRDEKIRRSESEARCLRYKLEEKQTHFQLFEVKKDELTRQLQKAGLDIEKSTAELASKQEQVMELTARMNSASKANTEEIAQNRQLEKVLDALSRAGTPARDLELSEEVGSLKTSMRQKDQILKDSLERERSLKAELSAAQIRIVELEEELKNLRSSQHYLESEREKELEKIKRQKADIRLELIKVQRQNRELQSKMSMDTSEPQIPFADAETHKEEKNRLEEEISALREELEVVKDASEKKDAEIEQLRLEVESKSIGITDKELNEAKSNAERAQSQLELHRGYLKTLDEQCEELATRVKTVKTAHSNTKKEYDALLKKYHVAELELERKRAVDSELAIIKADNDRIVNKNRYLTEELQATHLDYREELARMAREISESKRREAKEAQEHKCEKTEELQRQMTQLESNNRSQKRQIDELKQDNEKIQQQVSEALSREKTVTDENVQLRQGLAQAVAKLEELKRDAEDAKELSNSLAEQLTNRSDQITKLEDYISELESALREKEGLAAYLQSQINVKQLPKASRRSTLLTAVSETSSIPSSAPLSRSISSTSSMEEVENVKVEVLELESQMSALRQELEEKNQMRLKNKVPPTQNDRPVPSAPPRTPFTPLNKDNIPPPPTTEKKIGKMRHDIPHRWKNFRRYGLTSSKCDVCFIGIGTFGRASRCDHCGITVHAQCSARVFNTCGLPHQYEIQYKEQTASLGGMNGWINIFRDDVGSRKWDSVWARMDENSISFFNQQNVQGDLSNPFYKIDFNKEQFCVRAGCAAPSAAEDMLLDTSVIQIKLSTRNIYILAPSHNAARRWTEALQAAQTRRMILTRKPSSFSEQGCLLTIPASNFTIHSTAILDDYLLIGTGSGLFYTNLHATRLPMRIAGVESAIAVEIMHDLGTVALICGAQKSLALVPLATLKAQLNTSRPSIRPDIITGLKDLHLISFHEQHGKGFLFAADQLKLHVLKYSPNKDLFLPFGTIETAEPVMCMQSAYDRFYFGADSFFTVDLTGSKPMTFELAESHVADYPISVLPISTNEVLLAYQNHGIFVNNQGKKTRDIVVEWEQMPMEFAFTEPYLYVIHYDSIEIMQLSADKQNPIAEEREVFTCVNAHIVGKRSNGDIIISISSKDQVELHRFNATSHKRSGKRRVISMSAFHQSDKRAKLSA